MSYKSDFFKDEINYIDNAILRDLAIKLIEQLPDYFFQVPASSTGKYHPSYTLGTGGLVRHTKAAIRIAMELFRLEMYASLKSAKNYIIIALMLHDGWKHGFVDEQNNYSEYSIFAHPKISADWVRSFDYERKDILEYIASLIETHMGQWNTNYRSGLPELEKPKTAEQCFVHLCDYLASRKCLEFNNEIPFEGL